MEKRKGKERANVRFLIFQVPARSGFGCVAAVVVLGPVRTQDAVSRLGVPLQRLLPARRGHFERRGRLRRPVRRRRHRCDPGRDCPRQYRRPLLRRRRRRKSHVGILFLGTGHESGSRSWTGLCELCYCLA